MTKPKWDPEVAASCAHDQLGTDRVSLYCRACGIRFTDEGE